MLKWSLKATFIVSLALHLIIMLMGHIGFERRDRDRQNPVNQTIIVEVTPPDKEQDFKNQIVRTDKGQEAKEAAKDAFLGEKTLVVEEETVSKGDTTAEGNPQTTQEQKQANVQKSKKQPKVHEPHKLFKKFGMALFKEQLKQQEAPQDQPEWNNYGSQYTQGKLGEYVKGLKKGEYTALNTREYIFYAYFERIRKRLDLAWRPLLRSHLQKMFHKGRGPASDMDHSTKTLVTLNGRGEIIRVELVEESGTRDLDEAAVRAFNRAGPFPNPPTGIGEDDGTIRIRWEFILRT